MRETHIPFIPGVLTTSFLISLKGGSMGGYIYMQNKLAQFIWEYKMRQQNMKQSSSFHLCSDRPKTAPNTGLVRIRTATRILSFLHFCLNSKPTNSVGKAGLHASTTFTQEIRSNAF